MHPVEVCNVALRQGGCDSLVRVEDPWATETTKETAPKPHPQTWKTTMLLQWDCPCACFAQTGLKTSGLEPLLHQRVVGAWDSAATQQALREHREH